MKDIPIFINNMNRVTTLRKLIDWFLKRGYKNITVMDNVSTYPPLLAYYKEMQPWIKVIYLPENHGSKIFWTYPPASEWPKPPFIFSDSDVVPSPECPDDLIPFLAKVMDKYGTHKVAPALHIDDIPDGYSQKERVLKWESQMWAPDGEVDGVQIYRAGVDTTIALYSHLGEIDYDAVRTGAPYMATHLPWYCVEPTEEDVYFRDRADNRWHHWGFEGCYSELMRDFEP
jgi:hypothetical protein